MRGRCLSRPSCLELKFEKFPAAAAATIAGRSTASHGTRQLLVTETGKRYRSGGNHPVDLHRHTFEVTKVGDKPTAELMKDTINMTRFSSVEFDFVADDPGPALLHCHHQDHQDEGFIGLAREL